MSELVIGIFVVTGGLFWILAFAYAAGVIGEKLIGGDHED